MIFYIIDGNNLIGRNRSLKRLQNKNKQASREKLVHILNRFFSGKKVNVTLHLDGHPNNPLLLNKGKIEYSLKQTSDTLIRTQIEYSQNPRLITLITSDNSLSNFGKVCGCTIVSSDEFSRTLDQSNQKDDEEEKIKHLENDKDEFFKLFHSKEK